MKNIDNKSIARILITCPDSPGIVASVSNFFYNQGANITALDQHSSQIKNGIFFMRLEFQDFNESDRQKFLIKSFQDQVAKKYNMEWTIHYTRDLKRLAVFVSKKDHALLDLLWTAKQKDFNLDLKMVISNHDDLRKDVESFGVPFYHISKLKDLNSEQKILDLLDAQIDFIVLARYMQILSSDFVETYKNKIINIHHSFLPAFKGADPYKRAYERGVKLVGATAHFVTEDLDEGPIIEQDVKRVSHRYTAEDLKSLGRDIEKSVLTRAVKWYLEDRIIIHGNKTIVFN